MKRLYMTIISGTIPRIQRRMSSSSLVTTEGCSLPQIGDPKLITPSILRLSRSRLARGPPESP